FFALLIRPSHHPGILRTVAILALSIQEIANIIVPQSCWECLPAPPSLLIGGTCCWLSTGMGGRERAAEAIDLNGCIDMLELFPAEPLQPVVLSKASRRLRSDENFTGFGNVCQTGHQVRDGTAGRERPPRPTYALKTGRTDQGNTGVEAHMHSEWLQGIFSVERLRGGEEREGGIRSPASMLLILKDSHEAIAGSFIDITAGSMDEIEKRGKIAFNQ